MTGDAIVYEEFKEEVELLSRDLLLLARTVSIYPNGHPQLAVMTGRITRWARARKDEHLSIGVTSSEIVMHGEFFGGKETRAEVLARFLHSRKIARLTMMKEIDDEEIYRFANLLSDRSVTGEELVNAMAAKRIEHIEVIPLDLGELHDRMTTAFDNLADADEDFRRRQEIWLWLQGESGSPREMAKVLASEEFWLSVFDEDRDKVRHLADILSSMGSMVDRALRLIPDERRAQVKENLSRVGASLDSDELAQLIDVYLSDGSGTGDTMAALMQHVSGDKMADLMAGLVSLGGEKEARLADFAKSFLAPEAMLNMASMAGNQKKADVPRGYPPEVWEWIESFLLDFDENKYMGEGYRDTLDRMASRLTHEGEKGVSFGMYEDVEMHLDSAYVGASIECEGGLEKLSDRITERLEDLDGVGILNFLETLDENVPESLQGRDDVMDVLFKKALPDVKDYSASVKNRLIKFAVKWQSEVLDVACKMLLVDERISVRRYLVELMCHFSPKHSPALVQRARGAVWYFLRNCLIVLGRMRDPRALPFIIEQLKHEMPQVRKEALRSLAFMDERGVKALQNYSADATKPEPERLLAKSVLSRMKR